MPAQLLWTPVDVVSQRLMVQGSNKSNLNLIHDLNNSENGFEALRKILGVDGPRGFYRGFGVSIVTYVPSNAVWWASYSMVVVVIVGVQWLSAVMASGVSAVVAMPLDSIKTMWMLHKLQVLDSEEIKGQRRSLTLVQVVRNSVKKGGILGCYKGLGPRWASMSMSAATMITTYEFLKRVSAKNLDRLTV
ncbi:Solute carrier family 25 member 44 [Glycine max]|nr:Solute carrier family 25 member 44 [Glycine max]